MIGIRDRNEPNGYKTNSTTQKVDATLSSTSNNPPSGKAVRNAMPFNFGIDEDGNYGYIPIGADSVVPFSNEFKLVYSTNESNTFEIVEDGKYIVMAISSNLMNPTTNAEIVDSESLVGTIGSRHNKVMYLNAQKGNTVTMATSGSNPLFLIFKVPFLGKVLTFKNQTGDSAITEMDYTPSKKTLLFSICNQNNRAKITADAMKGYGGDKNCVYCLGEKDKSYHFYCGASGSWGHVWEMVIG